MKCTTSRCKSWQLWQWVSTHLCISLSLFWKDLICASVCLVWSGPVRSVPIEFPCKCTCNCTYAFPRRCISVNPRKSVVFTYEFPHMCISVNPHKCIVFTYEFPRRRSTLHLHSIVLFPLVLILLSSTLL